MELTLAIEIVANEKAGLELTLNKSAVRKCAASECAVNKLAFHEIDDIEDTPVPIDILKRAGRKIRLDVFSLRGDTQELAVLEAILAPIH